MSNEWTLKELAAETNVPERTIRFYISRGLVEPPLRGGRGASYGEKHKVRLVEIRMLQAKGLMLAEISHVLADKSSRESESPVAAAERATPGPPGQMLWFEPDGSLDERFRAMKSAELETGAGEPFHALPEPENWRAYPIAPDVTVMLRSGTSPWRTKGLLAALRRFAAQVEDSAKKEEGGSK